MLLDPYQWMASDQEAEPVDDETDMKGFNQFVWFSCQISFANSLLEPHCQTFDPDRLIVLAHEAVSTKIVHGFNVNAFPPAYGIHGKSLNAIGRQSCRAPGSE